MKGGSIDIAETPKRVRADAERNRARLVEVAKIVFATQGVTTTLEQIAREAKVGIGTLYRHFPTRDALIEAVYRQEVDELISAAAELARTRDHLDALRRWLLLFVEFLDVKLGMAGVLDTLMFGPEQLYEGTPAKLDVPVRMLVERARSSGRLSTAIEPMDFLRTLAGIASIRPDAHWKQAAERMVEVLLRG